MPLKGHREITGFYGCGAALFFCGDFWLRADLFLSGSGEILLLKVCRESFII